MGESHVCRGPAIGAALLVVTGAGAAGASPALGQVVGTNPVNYTPNINQGAVYKSAEVTGCSTPAARPPR